MTHRDPSPLAKGVAAGASTLVFVALVAHAQWGCDRAKAEPTPRSEIIEPEPEPPTPATAPASVMPAPDPAEATAPRDEPTAEDSETREEKTTKTPGTRAGLYDVEALDRSVYLGSTKSDPDMWSHWAATHEVGEAVDVPTGDEIANAHDGHGEAGNR